MKCPVCKTDTLVSTELLAGLPAHHCTTCQGTFISSNQYWDWLKSQKALEPELPLDDTDASKVETSVPKICPDCGHLLWRYQIWPNVEFFLDFCGHCNGIWLDKDEWETLQRHHLHNRINLFLTKPWQQKVRDAEMWKKYDQLYLERFGEEDYARIKEIRNWLDNNPRRQVLLTFLTDAHPYKA